LRLHFPPPLLDVEEELLLEELDEVVELLLDELEEELLLDEVVLLLDEEELLDALPPVPGKVVVANAPSPPSPICSPTAQPAPSAVKKVNAIEQEKKARGEPIDVDSTPRTAGRRPRRRRSPRRRARATEPGLQP
jgi:hypothetical protein